jgi:hypothetical protein
MHRTFGLGNGNSGSIDHCASDTASTEANLLDTSRVEIAAVSHKFVVGDEVSVEGRIGERAPRTMTFPAFVEELLPGGGYNVRRVLSNKAKRSWVKIEDGCRVQAPVVLSSGRESIEDRSLKNYLLAAAEARAEEEKFRANEREMQLEREIEKRKEAERKGKLSAKEAAAEMKRRVAAENKRIAEVARTHSTFAMLVEDGVAAQTAHLQTEIEAVRRESAESNALVVQQLRDAQAESTAYKKRALEEEQQRARAENETAVAFKRADEAGRAAAEAEKENASTVRALRRIVANADALGQQGQAALKAQHDVTISKLLRPAQTTVHETKETAAAKHATDLLRHEQVRLFECTETGRRKRGCTCHLTKKSIILLLCSQSIGPWARALTGARSIRSRTQPRAICQSRAREEVQRPLLSWHRKVGADG